MSTPRPILSVHGEDADVEVPGLLTIRASFLSEGLFDPEAGGLPDEEDLYDIEVTHARDELLEPITFPRLMPATSRRFPEEDDFDALEELTADLPIERFLLVLAWELAHAHPTNWENVCRQAKGWDAWTLEDAMNRIPAEWTPVQLLPDED
ncbi:MAG TPA: hypothetical protein VFU47_11795 [Armatimonadota bacterium]|nr:hypothetical protein [Armatimonadota bacterium]